MQVSEFVLKGYDQRAGASLAKACTTDLFHEKYIYRVYPKGGYFGSSHRDTLTCDTTRNFE